MVEEVLGRVFGDLVTFKYCLLFLVVGAAVKVAGVLWTSLCLF